MAVLSWDEICKRALSFNKKIIKEIEKNKYGHRQFTYECLTCGIIISNYHGNVFRDGCKNCSSIKRFSDTELKAKLKCEKYGFKFLSHVGMKGRHSYWLVKCNICSEEKATQLVHINSCKTCHFNKRRLTLEEFILKSKIVHSDKFDYSRVKFNNTKDKVIIKCNTCQHVFSQEVGCHYQNGGTGCPKCCESKGEKRVHDYLLPLNIKTERQRKFSDCKNQKHLPFDFYLSELNLLIEFDGEGHFGPFRFSKNKKANYEKYLKTVNNDKIKNEWAKANNIPLLRIPYWDFDRIEELIEAFIFEHTRKKEMKQLVLEI
jgi:hypothetical protein